MIRENRQGAAFRRRWGRSRARNPYQGEEETCAQRAQRGHLRRRQGNAFFQKEIQKGWQEEYAQRE